MLTIIGVVGLSIDVGHAFLNKTRLQNSLDSAALSGARTLMLSNDTEAASADAREIFNVHLDGEMANLDAGNLILQYSDTLVPFVAGGSSPRYVRATFRNFSTELSFSSVLPDVDGSMSIAGSAVAGPIPVGYPGAGKTCDIAPLLVCEGDYDKSREYQFQLKPGSDSETADEHEHANARQQQSRCGEGSIFYDCVPTPGGTSGAYGTGSTGGAEGTGKFLLNSLGCAGDNCIRANLAGAFNSCLTENSTVAVEQGTSPEPIRQGLMARFGVYRGSLSAAKYPPDVVVTDRTENVDYWYDSYKQDVVAVIAAGSSANGGVPYRRVVAVPIVNCQEGGIAQSASSVLRFECLFLTRLAEEGAVDALFYGQFVSECEASGEQGESVPGASNNYTGPMEIILYKDPDTYES
jgi:hypothetical protein